MGDIVAVEGVKDTAVAGRAEEDIVALEEVVGIVAVERDEEHIADTVSESLDVLAVMYLLVVDMRRIVVRSMLAAAAPAAVTAVPSDSWHSPWLSDTLPPPQSQDQSPWRLF